MSATNFESIPTTRLADATGGAAQLNAPKGFALKPEPAKSLVKPFKPAPLKLTSFARWQEPISWVKPKSGGLL